MDTSSSCFMLLFWLLNVEFLPEKRNYEIISMYIFLFLFPSFAFSESLCDFQLTSLHHLTETHILKAPRPSITSSVSPEGYSIPPRRGNPYHREERGRAQKHLIGWHPWPHTHSDATKWLKHTQKHLMVIARAGLTDKAELMLPSYCLLSFTSWSVCM